LESSTDFDVDDRSPSKAAMSGIGRPVALSLAVLELQEDFDSREVLCPLAAAERLLESPSSSGIPGIGEHWAASSWK